MTFREWLRLALTLVVSVIVSAIIGSSRSTATAALALGSGLIAVDIIVTTIRERQP